MISSLPWLIDYEEGCHESNRYAHTDCVAAVSGTCSANWRTAEGLKNLQKQPPTALKAGVAKFVESVGGKLEFWYFDYGAATAYSVIDYPDEVAAATAQLSTNAAGFARVTIRPLLTAEEMDKAVAKWPPVRVPQQQ